MTTSNNNTQTAPLAGAVSTHAEGLISFIAAENIPQKYVFGSFSNNNNTISVATAAEAKSGNRAIGVITDTANQGNLVNVQILGSNSSTMKVRSGGQIKPGDLITASPTGTAISLSNQPQGTYYVYGIALTTASDNSLVEFTPAVATEKEIK